MKPSGMFVWLAALFSLQTCTQGKIGYFWHITDFHYDETSDTNNGCELADIDLVKRSSSIERDHLKRLSCGCSWRLIESAVQHMQETQLNQVEFVLWTGDVVSGRADSDRRWSALRNVTELLGRAFSSQFVFPVLGHNDPPPSAKLNQLWKHWLPTEALQTLDTGGWYTIEQSHSKLRIVALNTNLMLEGAERRAASKQWDWLEALLDKASADGQMVYLVGHAGPGVGNVDSGFGAYSSESNGHYLRLARRHAAIIAGQFYGHLHVDTFRLLYDVYGNPISWAMMAPSISPRGPSDDGSNSNPGLRLYKFDTKTGKVLDYSQYYLDMLSGASWRLEYNLTREFALRGVSARELHRYAERLIGTAQGDQLTLQKYLSAYSVRARHADIHQCDAWCSYAHYCAISRLDYEEFGRCQRASPGALASAASQPPAISLSWLEALVILLLFMAGRFDVESTAIC